MQLRFIHAADIHLGYTQYNLDARADDFARAYFAMIDHAVGVRADFVLIAGDLFHHVRADPLTFKQASMGLANLREAGIPVVAVEGNHDTVYSRKDLLSWLGLLGQQELLHVLNVETAPNGLRSLVPFDQTEGTGSWIDVAGARIYGIKYYGAATARVLDDVQEQIESGPEGYTILTLHAGMEGQVPHLHGGLTAGQIETFRDRVDYLALGHIHKRLEMGDWVYNPGSLETNSMEEIDWPHGFFDVQVDTTRHPKHTVRSVQTPGLRLFRRISVAAEEHHSLDDFVHRIEEQIAAEDHIPERAVIELHLGGVASFRRQDVPLDRLKGVVESRFSPLVVRVRNNLAPPGLVSVRNQERLSRSELERRVVEQLVYQHPEFRDRAVDWARLILDVKNMAAEKDLPASIGDHVRGALSRLGDSENVQPAVSGSIEARESDASIATEPPEAWAPAEPLQTLAANETATVSLPLAHEWERGGEGNDFPSFEDW